MELKTFDIEHVLTEVEEMKGPGVEIDDYSYNEENSIVLDNEESQFDNDLSKLQSIKVDEEPAPEEKLRLLTAYFKDVCKEDLFSHEQVLKVSATIKKYEEMSHEMGEFLARYSGETESRRTSKVNRHIKLLTLVINTCDKRAKSLKQEFTKANLRLVINIAGRYMNRGIPMPNLIQEGNIGLMKAVEKFDHTKGYRFSTYATWWIYQSMTRAVLYQKRTIKMPIYVLEKAKTIFKISASLQQKLGRKPTPKEIATTADMSVEQVISILQGDEKLYHLDSPIGEGEKATFLDLLEDTDSPTPYSVAENISLAVSLSQALSILTPREREVIMMRFGIEHGTSHTLDEIGRKFNISRERIRQIEKEALGKIASSELGETLKAFLEQ